MLFGTCRTRFHAIVRLKEDYQGNVGNDRLLPNSLPCWTRGDFKMVEEKEKEKLN